MAEFLNTQKLRDYLPKLIETAERELVYRNKSQRYEIQRTF